MAFYHFLWWPCNVPSYFYIIEPESKPFQISVKFLSPVFLSVFRNHLSENEHNQENKKSYLLDYKLFMCLKMFWHGN